MPTLMSTQKTASTPVAPNHVHFKTTYSSYDRQYTPLLHSAGRTDSVEVVRLLIDSKADIRAKCSYNQTALHRCARQDNVAVCRLLVDASVDINAMNKYSCAIRKPFPLQKI
jgi:ankyrin repeat protein